MTTKDAWPRTPTLPPSPTTQTLDPPLALSIQTAHHRRISSRGIQRPYLDSPRCFSTPNLHLPQPTPHATHPTTPTLPYPPCRHVSSTYIDWVGSQRKPSLPDFPTPPEATDQERTRPLQRSRSLSRIGSGFRYPRSPGFEDRRESGQDDGVTVSKGVTATGVSGGMVVVGERTVGWEVEEEGVRVLSVESGKMGMIERYLVGF